MEIKLLVAKFYVSITSPNTQNSFNEGLARLIGYPWALFGIDFQKSILYILNIKEVCIPPKNKEIARYFEN
jgi:hypothetical protein